MEDRKRKRRIRGSIDDKVLDGYFPPAFPGYLIAEEVKALVGTLRISVEALMEKLLPEASKRAVVPVSNFRVGCVCRGESGNLYFGSNIEFNGQPLSATIHAEQAAVANAIACGESGIKALAVTAAPCGGCRQFLKELRGAEDLKIQVAGKAVCRLRDLLPDGFGPADLGVEERLMDNQPHDLQLVEATDDKLTLKALQAAAGSHAPYSGCHAAVALEIDRGFIFTGSYAENAAYNTSLLPLQSALSVLLMRSYRFINVRRAVLVQVQGKQIDHETVTRELFQSISKAPLTIAAAERNT